MPNKAVVGGVLIVWLCMAGLTPALAQGASAEPPATPTPSAPPPDRDYRSSEEVSADAEVDFPADL